MHRIEEVYDIQQFTGQRGVAYSFYVNALDLDTGGYKPLKINAQSQSRWNVGDEIEVKSQGREPWEHHGIEFEQVSVNKPGFTPKGPDSRGNGQGTPGKIGTGFKPGQNTFKKPEKTELFRQHSIQSAPVATTPRLTMEEADVAYDRIHSESLRAVAHTLEDYFGKEDAKVMAAFVNSAALTRTNAIFSGFLAGRINITPRKAAIKELVEGMDEDLGL